MPQVVIGKCPQCEHALKVKEHAPRRRMHYTCTCGWQGAVEPEATVVTRAEELRLQGVGRRHRAQPSLWRRFVRTISAWFHSASQ